MALDRIIAAVLDQSNMQQDQKDCLQDKLENALRHELGGQRVYVNKNKRVEPAEVKAAFNGRNVGEIQQRFGISRSRIYEILNDERI